VVRDSWPHLGIEDIRQLADLGSVFRLLAMIHWLSLDLAYPWVIKPMAGMRVYQAEMAQAILQAGGWVGCGRGEPRLPLLSQRPDAVSFSLNGRHRIAATG
jgi:hypothetical protein